MRLRILIPVVLAALAVVAGAVLFEAKGPRSDDVLVHQSVASNTPAPEASPALPRSAAVAPRPAGSTVVLTPKPAPSEDEVEARNAVIEERISELNELAASDDPNDLQQILGELDNAEPRIRAAAVEAAVQFKSPDAIPALQSAFERATDLDEKLNIRHAIEFLTPPVATSDQ